SDFSPFKKKIFRTSLFMNDFQVLPSKLTTIKNKGASMDLETSSASDAISAFIKSVRLRRPEDAITWLVDLWRRPSTKPRVQRRVLICSGEDNLSVGVIERASDWYNGSRRRDLDAAATEVLRICQTKNWWAQKDGYEYLLAWRRAELVEVGHLTFDIEALHK